MALYEFYSEDCPHCKDMHPIVDKLIKDGIKIKKLETRKNKKNEKKRQELDDGYCGGIPFFINTDSGEWICGSTDEKKLRKWAKGKKK